MQLSHVFIHDFIPSLFRNDLLGQSKGVESIGSILPDNFVYLLVVWVLTYFAIFKGVNWAAKVRLVKHN